MNARRAIAALAISCACLWPAHALGQQRPGYGPPEPPRAAAAPIQAPRAQRERLPVIEEPAPLPAITMIEAWSVGENAEFGLGRFRVMEIARPRSNLERQRDPLIMERETRAIAGAGLSIRFR